MVKACFVHSWGFLSLNLSLKMPELTTSWCSISRIVQINPLVDPAGFSSRAAMNWSCSSIPTPAAGYMISWLLSTSIRLYSHPIACCFISLLLPVEGQFWTVHPGSYFCLPDLQRCSELSGVCVVVGSQRVAYWMKCLSLCLLLFHSHLAEVFVEPWFAAVEVKRWW